MARGTRTPHDLYSPERPTAVILSGTGADGAYHAGVLKALDEAGVKVDLVAGRGIGAFGALLFALDGAATLWEPRGFWDRVASAATGRDPYGLRWPYRLTGRALTLTAAILVSPLLLLVSALLVWPATLLGGWVGLSWGQSAGQGFVEFVGWAFAPDHLPSWIARLVVLVAGSVAVSLCVGAGLAAQRAARRQQGHPFWRLLGAPIDSTRFARVVMHALWDLMRGGAKLAQPTAADLSERAGELLASSVNQPGHRDLVVTVHDLDARRDLVFGLVAGEAGKRLFPGSTGPSARQAEAFDLGGSARGALADVVSAALTLPGVSEPHPMRFSADSLWRGEVHRLADRPAALSRLLEEAAAAGVEQAIVVTAAPAPGGPHELEPPRIDPRGRVGEWIASEESAAVRDAVRFGQAHFHAVFVIRPAHNPLRPLDLAGTDDRGSDRLCTVRDLLGRGYDDANQQFIEPALGAAGERVRGATR